MEADPASSPLGRCAPGQPWSTIASAMGLWHSDPKGLPPSSPEETSATLYAWRESGYSPNFATRSRCGRMGTRTVLITITPYCSCLVKPYTPY